MSAAATAGDEADCDVESSEVAGGGGRGEGVTRNWKALGLGRVEETGWVGRRVLGCHTTHTDARGI